VQSGVVSDETPAALMTFDRDTDVISPRSRADQTIDDFFLRYIVAGISDKV